MNTSLFIAFRYWRSKRGDRFGRLVSNLAALGIVLGVMALIIVLSVMNGLETMQKQNLLTLLPHAIVSPIEENLQKNAPIQALAAVSSVVKSVPINRANVVIQSQEGINAGVLIGIENRTDDPLVNSVIDIPHLLPQGEFNLLISTRLAQKLRLNIGDKIRLMITENSQYTPFVSDFFLTILFLLHNSHNTFLPINGKLVIGVNKKANFSKRSELKKI